MGLDSIHLRRYHGSTLDFAHSAITNAYGKLAVHLESVLVFLTTDELALTPSMSLWLLALHDPRL
jgi:hypothetical protein